MSNENSPSTAAAPAATGDAPKNSRLAERMRRLEVARAVMSGGPAAAATTQPPARAPRPAAPSPFAALVTRETNENDAPQRDETPAAQAAPTPDDDLASRLEDRGYRIENDAKGYHWWHEDLGRGPDRQGYNEAAQDAMDHLLQSNDLAAERAAKRVEPAPEETHAEQPVHPPGVATPPALIGATSAAPARAVAKASSPFARLAAEARRDEDEGPEPAGPAAAATVPAAVPAPAASGSRPKESPFAALARRDELAQRMAERREWLEEEEARRAPLQAEHSDESDPPWSEPTIPAGSAYSVQEWEAAREGGRFIVLELRAGQESGLLQLERPPASRTDRKVVNGKVTEVQVDVPAEELERFIDPLQAMLLEDCLLLGPKAPNQFPNAISGRLEVRGIEWAGWAYRIIRPETHRESRPYLYGASGWVSAPLQLAEPEPDAPRERQRG